MEIADTITVEEGETEEESTSSRLLPIEYI
jgi:hypothetical protein